MISLKHILSGKFFCHKDLFLQFSDRICGAKVLYCWIFMHKLQFYLLKSKDQVCKIAAMKFPQKIYFNDKPLILTTDKAAYIRENPEAVGYSVFSGTELNNYNLALVVLDSPEISGAIIEDATEEALLNELKALYHSIDAAGGVAYNERGEILMIYRRGKWDLPKGKRDDGEQIEECALREVKEETGLKHLELGGKICDTYHIYSQYGEQVLKRTAWYKMSATSKDRLKPQKAENILEARWVREQDLGPLVEKTYEAIRAVLRQANMNIGK